MPEGWSLQWSGRRLDIVTPAGAWGLLVVMAPGPDPQQWVGEVLTDAITKDPERAQKMLGL